MKDNKFQQDILNFVKSKKKTNLIDICNAVDMSPKAVQKAVKGLIKEGFNIDISSDSNIELSSILPRQKNLVINTRDYFGNDWIRFGALADTHLCSKYERLDVLNALYDIYEKEGIQTVYHGGNWIDGDCRFNKYDVVCSGVENQVKYFIQNYPQRKGIKTLIISGDDHEGWYVQREGINIGKIMQNRATESGRNDLIDLGYMERQLVFKKGSGESKVNVVHFGGGSSYAFSYRTQKHVEAFQGGEKPSVVLAGHLHKWDYCYPREVHGFQIGCVEDQTPFMRKNNIQAMVGGCIIELKQDSKGVFVRVRVEWMPFFDRKYYSYKW